MTKAIRDQAYAAFAQASKELQIEAAEAFHQATGFKVPPMSWVVKDLGEATAHVQDVGDVRYTRDGRGGEADRDYRGWLWLGNTIFTDLAGMGDCLQRLDRYRSQV